MRRARDASWIVSEDTKQFVGINLGADFCAEHEWGVDDLKKILGVTEDESVDGIERRRAKQVRPECVALVEHGDVLSLVVDYPHSVKSMVELFDSEAKGDKTYGSESRMHPGTELLTMWSGGDFGIRVRGDDNKAKLRELHAALMDGKVAVWLGGGGVFQNAGLCLAIIDKVDKKSKDVMRKADENKRKLRAAAEKTGIKKKIDAYNEQWKKNYEVEHGSRCWQQPPCGYYALTPQWGSDGKTGKKSKYKVVFWLNPAHQDENEYGWFTVEELEQWIEGKGPIPKRPVKTGR